MYQLKYRLRLPKPLAQYNENVTKWEELKFFDVEYYEPVVKSDNRIEFTFLNQTKTFEDQVNWNFSEYGKLWNYNLQYMDWLKQSSLNVDLRNSLATELYQNLWNGSLQLEPYPASLRIMNGIRFLSKENNADSQLNGFIKSETRFLSKRLEYHLLGNHLLENAFALYMAGCYFDEKKWKVIGQKLLKEQLDEQILEDGAHFECSPMYHQIIFFRVLELLRYESPESDFYKFMLVKAQKMGSWLSGITFANGDIPHFNDSTVGIAQDTTFLLGIASSLGVNIEEDKTLNESGYRRFKEKNFDLIADINGIIPSYQPGHAHADTFSYVLYHNNTPFIIDVGISTYNIGEVRNLERSTVSHNSVTINRENSSEVWSGFRVGRRAKVNLIIDEKMYCNASHNGYKHMGYVCERSFRSLGGVIEIQDKVHAHKERTLNARFESHIHFHPSIKILNIDNNKVQLSNETTIVFTGMDSIITETYHYCLSYNKKKEATKIIVNFEDSLSTKIMD